jgi:hypothetical protein
MSKIELGELQATGQTCYLKTSSLLTHAAILGSTGSGKTGLLLTVTEELVAQGVPIILVDVKGDLVNVALQGPLADRMHVRCITPGASHGESVNVFADLADPAKVSTAVTALLRMVGEDPDPVKSKAHSYLSLLLTQKHAKKAPCRITDIVNAVLDPGVNHLGVMDIDQAFPKRSRTALAAKLNNLLVAPSFKEWRAGVQLSMDQLLTDAPPGKTPVVVYSVAHLMEASEQQFAIQLLLNELAPWMRRQGGTSELRAVLVVDECVGLMPPHPANPPTKTPLLVLLKQARAFGVGVILASQNPVDLDYKGMSNCQTWLVGRLQMGRDKERVIKNVCASSSTTQQDMERHIGKLQHRQFLLTTPKGSAVFNTKQVGCELRGPMVPEEVAALYVTGQLVKGRTAVAEPTLEAALTLASLLPAFSV